MWREKREEGRKRRKSDGKGEKAKVGTGKGREGKERGEEGKGGEGKKKRKKEGRKEEKGGTCNQTKIIASFPNQHFSVPLPTKFCLKEREEANYFRNPSFAFYLH